MLYTNPELSHQLLEKITASTIAYLKAQIAAGADLVQLFDSWAGVLSKAQYLEFALPYIARICDAIDEVPVTVFAKGAYFVRKELGTLNCETIGLDWNMDIQESRAIIGEGKHCKVIWIHVCCMPTNPQLKKRRRICSEHLDLTDILLIWVTDYIQIQILIMLNILLKRLKNLNSKLC